MTTRKIKIVDDGSRYTVHQSLRGADNKYGPKKIIAQHLNIAEAMNLINTLRGISGYWRE